MNKGPFVSYPADEADAVEAVLLAADQAAPDWLPTEGGACAVAAELPEVAVQLAIGIVRLRAALDALDALRRPRARP